MNILVTGATGFVGKNLIPVLAEEYGVHILVRPGSSYESLGVGNVFVFNDNIPELVDYMKKNKIEGVVHLASLYIAQHQEGDIKNLILSNVYLGTAILETCKYAGAKWFLNTGTIWQNYEMPDYSDDYNPVNLYAATKQSFMTIAKFYIETTGLRFCTLKLCDTYGENDTRRKIMALFADAARNGTHIDMSAGNQKLDIVHIKDVVSAFMILVKQLHNNENLKSEYVVSSGKQISLKNLSALFEQVNNVKLDITWGGRPYREREVMKPYIGTLVNGWNAKIDIEEGMKIFKNVQ